MHGQQNIKKTQVMFYRNNVAGVSRIVVNYQATRRHLKTSIDIAKAGKVSLTMKLSRGNSTSNYF